MKLSPVGLRPYLDSAMVPLDLSKAHEDDLVSQL